MATIPGHQDSLGGGPGRQQQDQPRQLGQRAEGGQLGGEVAAIITSNPVLNDPLKKKQVVFSSTVGKGLGVQERNNAVSPTNMGIDDF